MLPSLKLFESWWIHYGVYLLVEALVVYLIAGIGTLDMTGDFPMGIGAGSDRLKLMSYQRRLFKSYLIYNG